MKNLVRVFIALFIFPVVIHAQSTIDLATSKIKFSVSNMGIRTVDGSIAGMKGIVNFDESKPSNSQFQVTFDVNTIDTDNKDRDKHLKNEDFFEVETYPTIKFSSLSVSKDGDGYKVRGNLTIKDVTKEIELPFSVRKDAGKTTLTGKLTIDRKAYHVGMGTGKFMVGYDIEVEVICVLN